MILGYARVSGGMLETHRDSYVLSSLKVVSTRRVFFAPTIALSAALMGFAISFIDLLYWHEIGAMFAGIFVALLAASQLGQLKLLSRELNGNELSGAVWGQISDLNQIRSDIAQRIDASHSGEAS